MLVTFIKLPLLQLLYINQSLTTDFYPKSFCKNSFFLVSVNYNTFNYFITVCILLFTRHPVTHWIIVSEIIVTQNSYQIPQCFE